MTFAAVLISGREWMWPAAGFLALSTLVLAWTYLRAPADKKLRTFCALLKLLGLAALAACLIEPLWTGQRAKPGANHFVVLVDNSQSMQIKDQRDNRTRGEALTDLLDVNTASWLESLEETFQVRRYHFDSRLQSARDFQELTFDGRASAIGAALRGIEQRFRGQPLAGVFLLTDGNATDLSDGALDLADLPPVHPVVIGGDETIGDVGIQRILMTQTAFEDAPVTVQADVLAAGYAGRTIAARISDHTGRVLEEQTQRQRRDGDTATFRFQLRPETTGLTFYRVAVAAKDETDSFTHPELSKEATPANNSRVVVVDRGKGPYRILYVSGRANWEFKFLNRALAEDDQIELVGLIRIARREPKFEFLGRIGESSNPLFRGFDGKSQAEQYDQPVLVRLNVKDPAELAGGFPKTAGDLFGYHAVILDDLEAEFFTRDQMTLLHKFVSERGGGFLMLGGAESFHQGQYERTPVGDLLPVYLDYVPETPAAGHLRLVLTREGWLQPWARLRGTEAEEKTRLDEMPAFQVVNRVRGVKPGASVIGTVRDQRGQNHPALVAQRFGHGRVGALLVGDLWRWGLRDEGTRQDLDKSWRQTIRWLVADVPERIELLATPRPHDPDQALTLQVRARDRQFQPLDNATVQITVRHLGDMSQGGGGPGAEKNQGVRLAAEASMTQAGLYEATYIPRDTGGYIAEAVVTGDDGVEIGRVQTGWSADPAADEFRSLQPNRALLEAIARQTGGQLVSAPQLERFVSTLQNRPAPITENWTRPIWHQPLVFLFALACFAGEWGLRRWKGMA